MEVRREKRYREREGSVAEPKDLHSGRLNRANLSSIFSSGGRKKKCMTSDFKEEVGSIIIALTQRILRVFLDHWCRRVKPKLTGGSEKKKKTEDKLAGAFRLK